MVGEEILGGFELIIQQLFHILDPIIDRIPMGISGGSHADQAAVIFDVAAQGF